MATTSPRKPAASTTLPPPGLRRSRASRPEPTPNPASCALTGRDRCAICAALARGEYREMPGLSLTREQAARLWRLDHALAEAVLEHLTCEGFLRRTARDTYVRADLCRP